MTALPANITTMAPPARSDPLPFVLALVPQTMKEAMDLGTLMAKARMVPVHLQGSPSDCLMVILQARRWNMDPFAVAQATSVIQGKLCYEGKLVAAVVNTSPLVQGRLSYRYEGEGEDRTIHTSGTPAGEPAPLEVTVRLKDARTNNKVWHTQPDQQLAYHSARVWARRYVPELIMGVYAPEEIESRPSLERVQDPAPAIEPPPVTSEPRKAEAPPIEVVIPGGQDSVFFPRTKPGLEEALGFIERQGAGVVMTNHVLLSNIAANAAKMPDLAFRVANIRRQAAEELAPTDDLPWSGADAGAEDPAIDPVADRVAQHRGDRPAGMTDEEASGLPPLGSSPSA
jgi:hypothetical protein